MKTATPTPGPWTIKLVRLKGGGVIIGIECAAESEGGSPRWVAKLGQNSGLEFEVELANARVIVAAPEMLAVLQRLVFVFDERKNFAFENFEDTVNMAREAIAKAQEA